MTDKELLQQWLQPGALVLVTPNATRILLDAIRARLSQCDRCGEVNPAEIHTCTPQEPLPAKSKGALSHEENKQHNKKILDKFYEENAHLYTAPPQEPVAWFCELPDNKISIKIVGKPTEGNWKPLYTAPPQREWQGLTDEEIREFEIWLDDEEEKHGWNLPADIVKYIEAKLKEKNT